MLNPDLPITKNSEDILNRSTFANSLAKTLLQYSFSSSLTIGLYGEWGSGKTSLLNMVLETVESKDSNTVILRFNPWLCSNSKQLITQFFKQLSAAIKLKKPKMNCTPFVRQYDILSNKWGDLLCQEENRTNDIRRNSRKWL